MRISLKSRRSLLSSASSSGTVREPGVTLALLNAKPLAALTQLCRVRFPRHFVCHQVNFMQPFFPDFAYSANVRYIELAIGSQVLNAGEFGYKTPQCIQN